MRAAANQAYSPMRDRRFSEFDAESVSGSGRVYKIGYLNDWQIAAITKIVGFGSLKQNWDSYNSPAMTERVIDAAIDFVARISIENVPAPHVIPVSGGGIQFEWAKGRRELEVEVRPNRTLVYLEVENDSPLEPEKEIEPGEIPTASERLLAWLNAG